MENIYTAILTATDDIITPNNEDCTFSLNEKKNDTLISPIGIASNGASTSNQDTHEIPTNASNLHLTSRVRVEVESSLKGHLKALS